MDSLAPAKTFKNEPTRRFYNFLKEKIDSKKITLKELSDLFKKNEDNEIKNPSAFLSQMGRGKNGVTTEQIIIAQEKLNLSPSLLFGEYAPVTVANEEAIVYDPPGDAWVGDTLHHIFEKHDSEMKAYAVSRLKITEQQLHNIFSGRSRAYFDTILTVCEDHSESLDQFRRIPLPKGHLLEENKNLKDVVYAQRLLIETLQKQQP